MHLSLRTGCTWRLTAAVVLLMLFARFALPNGFMPTVSPSDGGLVLSFCSSQPVAPPGAGVQAGHGDVDDKSLAAECPFGVLAMPSVLPDAGLDHVVIAFAAMPQPARAYRAVPPLPATGPPLGSRAPPFILV